MDYLTTSSGVNGEKGQYSMNDRIANMLFKIPEPAAHSIALQFFRTDGKCNRLVKLDRSLAICIGVVGLAVLEEMI